MVFKKIKENSFDHIKIKEILMFIKLSPPDLIVITVLMNFLLWHIKCTDTLEPCWERESLIGHDLYIR